MIHERTCAQVNNVEVKQLEVLRFRFSRHVSHVWTFRPLCSLLFSLPSFYAGHDPRVILFVSPLVLLPDADLPKITIKEWSDTVAPYPAVPQ